MIVGAVLAGLLAACVAIGVVAVRPRLLLRWYLREVRRLEVPQDRNEAIVTYPFA